MKEENMVITTDDVMNYFIEHLDLIENYNNFISKYSFKKDYGSGGIERIKFDDLEIWSIEYCFNSDVIMLYDMPENHFEIAYCIKGMMEHFERNINKKTAFREGQLSVYGKYNASGHLRYMKNIPYKGIAIVTTKEYISKRLLKYSGENKEGFFNTNKEWLDELYMGKQASLKEISIVKEMLECNLKSSLRLMFLEAKANEFLVLKYNELQKRNIEKRIIYSEYDIERFKLARKILVEDVVNPPSIEKLAKITGINATKLKKGFKNIFNNTIFGVLRDYRLELGKDMLFKEELSITDIANSVGYSNPSKFSKAFKTKYGLNPKEVRQSVISKRYHH